MSEILPEAVLKYLVKGVATNRDSQHDLQQELLDMLPNANAVVVQPVVDGFSVEIELAELGPFSRVSLEPYIAEHVLPDAVSIRCEPTGTPEFQLLKSHFY